MRNDLGKRPRKNGSAKERLALATVVLTFLGAVAIELDKHGEQYHTNTVILDSSSTNQLTKDLSDGVLSKSQVEVVHVPSDSSINAEAEHIAGTSQNIGPLVDQIRAQNNDSDEILSAGSELVVAKDAIPNN